MMALMKIIMLFFERMVYDCKIINYPHFRKRLCFKKGYQYVKEHLKDKKEFLFLENEYDLKLVDQMSQSINEDASKFYFVHHQGKKDFISIIFLVYNQNLSMSTVNCLAFQYLI